MTNPRPIAELAETVRRTPRRGKRVAESNSIRLGKISAVNGAATPPTLTVDGRAMAFVGVAGDYTVGKVVVYWNLGQPIVLGQLAR